MSTNVKPLQGRHRAPVEPRARLRPALPFVLGGLTIVLVGAVLGWQVL